MRIALSDLEFTIKGSGINSSIVPIFLQMEEQSRVQVIINFLNNHLGRKKKDILYEALWGIFPSVKLVKSLLVSSSRFFTYDSKEVKEILGKDNQNNDGVFANKSIVDYIPIEEKESLENLSPLELRELVFDFINKNKQGFVKTSDKESIAKEIERELKIPARILDELLFIDFESSKILKKKKEVEPAELIRYLNYDIIETLLNYAHEINFNLKKMPGYLAKNIVYLSKKNHVYTDITLEQQNYKISIEPPLEIFRDKGDWGRNMGNVATYILRTIVKESIEFSLHSKIQPKDRRKAIFNLNSDSLPFLPTFRNEEEYSKKPAIDSKVERNFLNTWRTFYGWKAIPEPEAIIIGKKMYVPDFLLERGNQTIYLEIVGFYTRKYIQKKKIQMQELTTQNLPIIYLIDENIIKEFQNLKNIVQLSFKNNIIPNSELLKILEEKLSDYKERFPILLGNLELIMKEMENVSIFPNQKIQDILKTYSEEETQKVLISKEAKKILDFNNIVFIQSYGLVKSDQIEEIKKFLTKTKTILLSKLKTEYPELKEVLIAICQHLGCQVRWKLLDDASISFN